MGLILLEIFCICNLFIAPSPFSLLYLGLVLSTMGEADSDPVKLCKASLTLC